MQKIDIRQFPSGGWSSAKISARNEGKWIHFFEKKDDSVKEINELAFPVDYKRNYKPPKRSSSQKEKPVKFINRKTKRNGVPTIALFNPIEHSSGKSSNTSKRTQSARRESKSVQKEKENHGKVHQYFFNNVPLPESNEVRKGYSGADVSRFPFRISILYLEDILNEGEGKITKN